MVQTVDMSGIKYLKVKAPLVATGGSAMELVIDIGTTSVADLKANRGSDVEIVTSYDLLQFLESIFPDMFSDANIANTDITLNISEIEQSMYVTLGSGKGTLRNSVLSQLATLGTLTGKYSRVFSAYDGHTVPSNILVTGDIHPTIYKLKTGGDFTSNPEASLGRNTLEDANWINITLMTSALEQKVIRSATSAGLPAVGVDAFEGAEAWVGTVSVNAPTLAIYRVVGSAWRDTGRKINPSTGAELSPSQLPSGATTGQVLKFDGTDWVAGTDEDTVADLSGLLSSVSVDGTTITGDGVNTPLEAVAQTGNSVVVVSPLTLVYINSSQSFEAPIAELAGKRNAIVRMSTPPSPDIYISLPYYLSDPQYIAGVSSIYLPNVQVESPVGGLNAKTVSILVRTGTYTDLSFQIQTIPADKFLITLTFDDGSTNGSIPLTSTHIASIDTF